MTLLISIDRTSLSLPPLVLSGSRDANPLGVTAFQEPGRVPRVQYMPDSGDVHGSEPLGWSWQQGILSWQTVPDAATEDAADALIAELVAAVSQFSYEVTVQRGGSAGTVWLAHVGSVTPAGGRTLTDLRHHNPAFAVVVPVYPIAS